MLPPDRLGFLVTDELEIMYYWDCRNPSGSVDRSRSHWRPPAPAAPGGEVTGVDAGAGGGAGAVDQSTHSPGPQSAVGGQGGGSLPGTVATTTLIGQAAAPTPACDPAPAPAA